MASDSGGKRKRIVNLLAGCFGRRKRSIVKPENSKQKIKTNLRIKLPHFRKCAFPYAPRGERTVRKNDAFIEELRKECLLASGSPTSDNPIIDICLGFKNEELQFRGPKIYHRSFSKSHWDRVLSSKKGLRRMISYSSTFNEPIVDDLPASLWMECLEPTLAILMTLNAMKHRRTNLSIRRLVSRTVSSTIRDSRVRHGDFSREPMNHMALIGPRFVFQERTVLSPTDEVRPSRMLDFGGSVRYDIDIVVEQNGRASHKNKNRSILTRPAGDPYEIEEDEPLAYTFPDDFSDEESDDSSLDSDDDDSQGDENFNQSASINHTSNRPGNTNIKYSTIPLKNVTQNSVTRSKLISWFWNEDTGRYSSADADDHSLGEVHLMRNHWLEYLGRLSSGRHSQEDSDRLYDSISKDPAYRRMFLKDAVLFLEDIDARQDRRMKNEKQTKKNEKKFTELAKDVGIAVQDISDNSCERIETELPPLPKQPPREKQLLSDDYVICNLVPRSTEPGPSGSVLSLDSITTSSLSSVQSVHKLESDPYDSVREICKPTKTDKHKAVVIFTDSYVLPKSCQRSPISHTEEKVQYSFNLLSLYASRSSEKITDN